MISEGIEYDAYKAKYIGYLMDLAHRHNHSLLYFVKNKYTAFAEMNALPREGDPNIWPQLIWYKLLYQQYPDSLFILNYRNLDHHIDSIIIIL